MFGALQYRKYAVYLVTRTFSLVGVSIQRLAFLWLIYTTTDSATWVAFGIVSRQLAQVVLSPWAGLLSDLVNRKKLIIITQIIAVVANVFAFFMIEYNLLSLAVLLFTELLLGLSNGLEQPVRQTFVYDLVPNKNHLGNAIALHTSGINFSQIVGPLIAAFLINRYGEAFCYLTNSFLLLFFIVGMASISYKPLQSSKKTATHAFLNEIKEGLYYAQNRTDIKLIMLLTMVASGFGFAYTVLLPSMADRVFGGEAVTLGLMQTAIALGSFVFTLVLALKKSYYGWDHLMYLGSTLYGITLCIMLLATPFSLALALLFLTGCAKALTFNSSKTALLLSAHPAMQGRMSGLYFMFMMGAVTLGGFCIGILADIAGISTAIFTFAALCSVLSLKLWFKHAGLKRILVFIRFKKYLAYYQMKFKQSKL